MTLAVRLRYVLDTGTVNEDLLQEINEVLAAIFVTSKKNGLFARALSYSIVDKTARLSRTIAGLRKHDPDERKAIIAFLGTLQVESFWNPNVQTSYTDGQSDFLISRGYSCVALCFALQESELHHSILNRFARLVTFRLTLDGSRTAASISKDFKDAGLYPDKHLEKLTAEISDIISSGRRYDKVTDELGGPGNLFFLPRIGRRIWEERLPKSGKDHEAAVNNLRDAGVPDASQPFHQLAEQIITFGLDAAAVVAHKRIAWAQTVWAGTIHRQDVTTAHTIERTQDVCKRRKMDDIQYTVGACQPEAEESALIGSSQSNIEQQVDAASILRETGSKQSTTLLAREDGRTLATYITREEQATTCVSPPDKRPNTYEGTFCDDAFYHNPDLLAHDFDTYARDIAGLLNEEDLAAFGLPVI